MVTATPIKLVLPALDPERVRTAARTALACVISLGIVVIYRFPEGYWALITCLVMTQASLGASLEKGISRVAGTAAACILAVTVLTPLNQDPLPFLLLTFAIIAAAAYLGTGTYHPYAFVIGGVTMVIVAILGFRSQTAAASLGATRTGEILVGVTVSWFAAYAFWPRRAAVEIDAQSRATLERISHSFAAARSFLLDQRPPPAAFRTGLDEIGTDIRNLLALIPAAAREGREHRRSAPLRRQLAIHLERLRAALLPLAEPLIPLPNTAIAHFVPELRASFDAVEDAWSNLVSPDGKGIDESLDRVRTARRRLEADVEQARVAGWVQGLTAGESVAFHGVVGTLREIENTLHAVARTLADIRAAAEGTPVPVSASSPSARLDPLRLRYALKTGFAVCLCIALLNTLQWAASESAMITTFIVTQLNIGGSVRKAFLRLAGALLGGILALGVILFVTPYIVDLPPFAFVVFVVLFFCAYAYTGPEKSAYAGLQTGLAFVIVLVAGPKQEVSMMPAVNRMVGVMIGTAVSIGVEGLLWPSHAYIDLRDRVRDALVSVAQEFHNLATGVRGAALDREALLLRARAARDRLAETWQILGEAMLEGREARAAIAFDLPVASAAEELGHRLARLAMRMDRPVPDDLRAPVAAALEDHLDRAETVLRRLPEYLDGSRPAEEAARDGEDLRAGNRRLLAALDVARRDLRFRAMPEEEVSVFLSLVDALLRISQGAAVTCAALSRRASH